MTALQFQTKLVNMQEQMFNVALMLTSNTEDAHDLLQDTTLKVLDNREKYVDNVNFKGWVMTIMRNIFINNYHRTVRTYTMIDYGADLYNLDTINDSGFVSPESSYNLNEISTAIENLPQELKNPFSLFVSGYQYVEIAEKLDIPLGTVKSRIFFARQELQGKLKDFR
ncbi:RNA polymerase sigma factor [Parabacteroides sp. OttesenSCG-928-G21]|nr:RNA polymerase sigma factor [Parabacteroides sp. OttesenSCG-928-G21]